MPDRDSLIDRDYETPAMHVICAWCGTILEHGDPGAPVSHGICSDCDAKERADIESHWRLKAGSLNPKNQPVEDMPPVCALCGYVGRHCICRTNKEKP